MPLDIPIALAFLYVFMTMNFYGWGIWHDQRFIGFTLAVAMTYAATALFKDHAARASVIVRAGLLSLFILVAVVVSSIDFVQLRAKTAPEGFFSDSGVALEVTGRFLLAGKNPYSESYEGTELARVPYKDEVGNTKNPALNHNAYPPFLVLLSAVSQKAMGAVLNVVDIRLVFVAFYLLLLCLGWKLFGLKQQLVVFLALVGINPMFISLMVQGANDVIVLAILLWSLWFLERKNFVVAGMLFGVSLATKQITWIAAPFVLFYAWQTGKEKFRQFLQYALGVSVLLYGPFLVWNAKALLDGIIFYMSGSLPTSYPINMFGFGMLLVALRVVPSVYSYYPFWIWQLAFFIPFMLVWYNKERRNPTLRGALTGITIGLSIVWFFNRFMNYNYVATLQILASFAYLWPESNIRTARKKSV